MKKLFLFCFIIPVFSSYSQIKNTPSNFLISGKIDKVGLKIIYLISYDSMNRRTVDSSKVILGKFKFSGYVNEFSNLNYLKLDKNQRLNNDSVNAVQIPVSKGLISIKLKVGAFSKMQIGICETCNEYLKYQKYYEKTNGYFSSLSNEIDNAIDTQKILRLSTELTRLQKDFKEHDFNFCEKYPGNLLAPYRLFWLRNRITSNDYHRYINCYNILSKKQKNSFYGNKIKLKLEEIEAFEKGIGTNAPNFSSLDINGNLLELKNINNNKCVLLDFWASWCVPCRKENKILREIYTKYSKMGLEIISISDDSNIEKWKNAVIMDSINLWRHILFNNSSIKRNNTINGEVNEYHITELPTKILININGEIVGRYQSDDNDRLKNDIESIFK